MSKAPIRRLKKLPPLPPMPGAKRKSLPKNLRLLPLLLAIALGGSAPPEAPPPPPTGQNAGQGGSGGGQGGQHAGGAPGMAPAGQGGQPPAGAGNGAPGGGRRRGGRRGQASAEPSASASTDEKASAKPSKAAAATTADGIPLQTPVRGNFVFQVKLVGSVEALKQRYLASTFSSKIAKLVEDGTVVKSGEVVAVIDSKTVEEELDDQQADLDVARSNLTEADRTAAADRVKLDAEIQRAQAMVDQMQLTLDQLLAGTRPEEMRKRQLTRDLAQKAADLASKTLELQQRLATKGLSTQLEVLQARLDLANKQRDLRVAEADLEAGRIGATPLARELARLDLGKAQRQLAWARQNRSLSDEQAALNHQNLVAKQNNVAARANLLKAQMSQSVIRAPMAGTVVLSKTWTNEGLKRPAVGDDVEEGNPFMSVADLSVVKVRTELDETLLSSVKIGMPCDIELPSLHGRRFKGKVSGLGVLAHERTGRQNTQGLSKVFDIEILPDVQEAAFQPGTSVDISLPFRQQANVLMLPRTAIWHSGKRFYVLMADGSQRDVTLGDANATDVVILTGLKDGEQVRMPQNDVTDAGKDAAPKP